MVHMLFYEGEAHDYSPFMFIKPQKITQLPNITVKNALPAHVQYTDVY